MNKQYTADKISDAMWSLAVEDKPLHERVAEAHRSLARTSCHDGFERDFELIANCLATADHNDYSGVARQDLIAVALTVMEMFRRLDDVTREKIEAKAVSRSA
jgi:hypothetical protein